MKKSVVLVISVIYILAVVIVGFLGLRMKVSNPVVYVDKIVCISDNYVENTETPEEYDGSINVYYEEGLKVIIKCQVVPDNADNKNLEYIYDDVPTQFTLTRNEDGTATIEFLKGGAAKITIRATDSKQTKITIIVRAIVSPF